MNEKRKSIIGVMLIIITLSGVFLYWVVRMYDQNMTGKIMETTKRTSQLIDHIVTDINTIYKIRLEAILNDGQLISAFNDRNRERLFKLALPWHTSMKKENPHYSNMHFHLPSGSSLLRMHKPDEFGDNLKGVRLIIMGVHESNQENHAYEIGKHGLFYRVIKPVFFNKKYIGALEIGVRVAETADHIKTMLGVRVARLLHARELPPHYAKYHDNEIRAHPMSLNPYADAQFFKKVVQRYDFKDVSPQEMVIDSHHFIIFQSGKLKNYHQETIAGFLVAQDISKDILGYRQFFKKSFVLTLVLISGAFVLLHFTFGSMIQKVIELNKTLESKVKSRTKDLKMLTVKLQQTNAELNQVFNTAADGMRIIDKNFNVLSVNTTFANLMGEKKQALENRPCHEWFKGVLCFTPSCTLTRILNGEKMVEVDVEKIVKGGQRKSFLLTATPYTSLDGTIIGVVENFKDITQRKKATNALKENEEYLNAIMSTVQAGVIVTGLETPHIINANPYAAELIGCSLEKLIGSYANNYFSLKKPLTDRVLISGKKKEKEDCLLKTAQGKTLAVRLSIAPVKIRDKMYLVQSFLDISDMKRLLEKQEMDINKAKSIMGLINQEMPRYCNLPLSHRLFTQALSVPCNAEGGDHYFVRHFPGPDTLGPARTFMSLKDQSGHEVNCIFRSIYTDLVHNAALHRAPLLNLDDIVSQLNDELCASNFFSEDDFFTSINIELDHQRLLMTYISCGHPAFMLIREQKVLLFPRSNDESHLPIPFLQNIQYKASRLQLQKNDQLIFYTDGLLEMTLRHLGRSLSTQELAGITQEIINGWSFSNRGQIMPVSQLMQALLNHVCALAQETVVGDSFEQKAINTSSDDVTLLCMEIETFTVSGKKIFYFKDSADISTSLTRLCQTIFDGDCHNTLEHLRRVIPQILEEVVVNAWKHGNKKDPKKSIVVTWYHHNDFVLEVTDQGHGFDFYNLLDPTVEENVLLTTGRGLFIVKHLSDHVQFRNNGRSIIISFQTPPKTDNSKPKANGLGPMNLW